MEIVGIAAVIIIAILINGLVAKIEDESPGGFENNGGRWKEALLKPRIHQVVVWLAGALVVCWLLYLWVTK